MNINVTYSLIGLRAAAFAALLSGNTLIAERLYALADLVEAGKATDAHMTEVAALLKSRTLTAEDFDAVMAKISANHAAIQS